MWRRTVGRWPLASAARRRRLSASPGGAAGAAAVPSPVLPPAAVALVARERAELEHAAEALSRAGLLPAGRPALVSEAAGRLEELLVVTVCGDWSCGKSALLNALLGGPFLEEGPIPTTDVIRRVRYGPRLRETQEGELLRALEVPSEWLRHTTLVDTPGTNAVFEGHAEVARAFVPRSDVILFVASVDQAMTQTQKEFLERIHRWRRRVVFVLNKCDLVQSEEDMRRVLEFVRGQAREVLRETPLVFTVSAKRAQAGEAPGPHDQFDEFRRWVVDTLTDSRKLELKLRGAVDVAQRLVDESRDELAAREASLGRDAAVAARLERDAEAFRRELDADFALQQERVDNVLLRMLDAADGFVQEQFRLRNAPSLLRSSDLRRAFDRAIGEGVNDELRRHVASLVDWLGERQERHADASLARVERRDEVDPAVLAGARHHERARRVDDTVRLTMGPEQRAELASRLDGAVRTALLQTAAAEAGALGTIGALAAASMMDVTGVAGAGALAVAGLYLVPARRAAFKRELRSSIGEMRDALRRAMLEHYETEQNESEARLRAALAPFTRRVKAEETDVREKRDTIDGVEAKLDALGREITAVIGPPAEEEEEAGGAKAGGVKANAGANTAARGELAPDAEPRK